jgi:hypothetical protein
VKALDRKLLRDLRLMLIQAITIALVVASGVTGFITSFSAYDALLWSRDLYYTESRFADVFASLKSAPQRLNRVELHAGRLMETPHNDDLAVLVSEGFANARKLKPGDPIHALMNGKRQALLIGGIALSPEYIFSGLGGSPDQRGFGVFWLDRQALAAACNMEGAFNQVAVHRNTDEVTARNVLVFSLILSIFATIIAVGVVCNNARIALAERAWELASLRVLGFTPGEVSVFLLGELALEIALAIRFGAANGHAQNSPIKKPAKAGFVFFRTLPTKS